MRKDKRLVLPSDLVNARMGLSSFASSTLAAIIGSLNDESLGGGLEIEAIV